MSSIATNLEDDLARDGVERRGSARAPLYMLVQARGIDEPLWAWDIGMGGMQCRTRAPRWPGTYLDLTFTLPGTGEKLEAGAQVLTLDRLDDDSVSLGLRFCMLSVKAQRAIYRFLDRRRALWERRAPGAERPTGPQTAPARPFERLLAEAYESLRAKELRKLGFVRSISCHHLPRLSELTGGSLLEAE